MPNFLLSAVLLLLEDESNQSWRQTNLTLSGRRRRDRRYPRISLRRYEESPFHYLYESKNDQALLNATGVDHEEFGKLLHKFKPLFDNHTIDEKQGTLVRKESKKGRKRSIDAAGVLGLILMWYRTRGPSNRALPLVFGLTFTPMERWLRLGKLCLFVALSDFAPKGSSAEDIQKYMNAIGERYPRMANVAFAADGLKLPIHPPANDLKQSKFYNGWQHGHYISNVFVFAADGTIPFCALNAPGCLHDSTVADYGDLYKKLQDAHDMCGAMCVIDSAFSLTATECFYKSSQTPPIGDSIAFSTNQQATSVRQLSEWGMRQIQAKFPRMADTIKYEEKGGRRLDLSLMVRLYNHQVRCVGMNQILDTYMKETSPEKRYFNHTTIDATAHNFVAAIAAIE